MREALALAIDDEVDLALSVEIDVLRAMAARVTEAEPFDQRDELARLGVACANSTNSTPSTTGGGRQRGEVGERRLAARGASRRERFARARAASACRRGDRRGGRAAKLVVEDFQRERAAIARARHGVEIIDDRIVALAGIAAIVPAQRQRVHLRSPGASATWTSAIFSAGRPAIGSIGLPRAQI